MKEYLKTFKDGIKLMFKEFFNKETNKKQRANMWTFSRLIIAFLIPIITGISLLSGSNSTFFYAFIATGFGALTDFFDGRSARKYNSYSEFGKLLDQAVDKVFAFMIGISLCFINPLFLVNLFGESAIALTNIAYKSKYNIDIKSTKIGKLKQWPLFITFTLGFVSLLTPSILKTTNIFIILSSLFQIATTSSYVVQNNKSKKAFKTKEIQDYINELEKENDVDEKIDVLEKTNNGANMSKKEQYVKLRDLLIEIKNNKIQDESKVYEGYQKRKTL